MALNHDVQEDLKVPFRVNQSPKGMELVSLIISTAIFLFLITDRFSKSWFIQYFLMVLGPHLLIYCVMRIREKRSEQIPKL